MGPTIAFSAEKLTSNATYLQRFKAFSHGTRAPRASILPIALANLPKNEPVAVPGKGSAIEFQSVLLSNAEYSDGPSL